MGVVDHVPYTVSTRDSLSAGDWTVAPHLICRGFTHGVGPTMSQAAFLWRYGALTRGHNDSPDGVFTVVAPLDVLDKFVRIEFEDAASGKSIDWVGVFKDDGYAEWCDSDAEPSGDQELVAYGLEYFLDRQPISGRSSREADRGIRPYSYNTGAGAGRDVEWAKRGNKDPGDYAFSFEDDAVEWEAWNIGLHLLAEHGPRNQDDVEKPLPFILHPDAEPFLNWYYPTVAVEGRTLLQVLDELIDRRRGLIWWIQVEDFAAELSAVIYVSSTATAVLALPNDAELPPAATIVTFDDPGDQVLLEPPQIAYPGSRRYDRVRVRGARRTSTFSALGTVFGDGGASYGCPLQIYSLIEPTWDATDNTDYHAAASGLLAEYSGLADDEKAARNDRYRQGSQFYRVYRQFSLNMQGASGDASICPIIAQGTGSIVGSLEVTRRSVRLLSKTLLKAGFDYADALNPTPRGNADYGAEFIPPFLLTYVPATTETPTTLGDGGSNPDGGWRRTQDANTAKEKMDGGEFRLRYSYHPRVAAGEPGFRIEGGPVNHMLDTSESNYDGSDPLIGPSRHQPECYWGSLLITATAEMDCYCEAVWPAGEITAAPIEELLVQLSDRIRHDWLQKGTVYDLNERGSPVQVQDGGAIQDDRYLCETIARLAHQWYSTERATVTLQFRGAVIPFNVGDLVTTIGTGAAQRTVNATVSQLTHNLEDGETTIHLGFAELDFSQLA